MIRHFLSSFALVFTGLGCAFLTHAVLAKTLNASEYGIYSFVFSVSLLIGVFALFGFQNASVKIISLFQTEAVDQNKTRDFCRFSTAYCFTLAVIFSFLVYGALFLLGLSDKYPKEALILGIFMTPLMVMMRLHSAFLRGLSKSTLSVLFETSLREILLLLIIVAVLIKGVGLQTGFQALYYLVIALFIASTLSWVTAWYHLKKHRVSDTKTKWIDRKEWLKLSFPMMLIIFAQRLLRRSDIIILGFMTAPAIVGAYAIAAQFSEASSIGQKGVFAVFSPKAAAFHKSGETSELKTLYRKMQWVGVASTGLLCALIIVGAPYLLRFFGADYTVAYNSVLILLTGQFINVALGPVGILMMMTGREQQAMKFTFAAVILNIIFNPLAIYFYGMEGAAIVTSVLIVMRGVVSYIDVRKQGIL